MQIKKLINRESLTLGMGTKVTLAIHRNYFCFVLSSLKRVKKEDESNNIQERQRRIVLSRKLERKEYGRSAKVNINL
jgi:hypothetical protein